MPRRTRSNRTNSKKKISDITKGKPSAKVFFFDEARFGLKPTIGRCWSMRGGETPLVRVRPGYQSFYLYSAVSHGDGEHFTLLLPWVNTDGMNVFLREFSQAFQGDDIILVLDCAGWHRSRDLQVPANIELVHLSPYSPELNPVERLWRWLRRHACRNRLFDSLDELSATLCDAIRGLSTEMVAGLCHCGYLS